MSTTTRCLFALGLSVSLFAACGDDDDDGFGGGGSSGRAGSGGSGGRAGAAGASGAAGNGGDAGSGGTGGTGGSNGGTGGSNGGTGGSGNAGTGGSGGDPGDAGPDATADGGDVVPPVDGGVEPIACDFVDENDNGIIDATEGADSSEGTQEVFFTRLTFVGGDFPGCTDEENGCIQVTFRSAVAAFNFGAPLQLCTGSELNGDCDAGVQALDASGDGDASTALNEGEEITYITGLGAIATPAAGELALVNGEPAVDADPIIRAYINWGGYVSLPATEGPNDGQSLEEAAAEEGTAGIWVAGATVEVDGQTTIFADGDVTDENGFSVCTVVP